MKALSLTQPWAWLVVHGGKTCENRKWNTTFRGRFLIHASKKMTFDDYAVAKQTQFDVCGFEALPPMNAVRYGGIVGVATLADVVLPGSRKHRWHFPDQYGFVLRDVRPLPFVACPGALGLWAVPEEIAKLCEVAP